MIGPALILWGHLLAALAFGALMLWQLQRWRTQRSGPTLAIAAAITTVWALDSALSGGATVAACLAEDARDIGWLTYLLLLWRGHDRADEGQRAVRLLYWVSFGVLGLRLMVDVLPLGIADSAGLSGVEFLVTHILRMIADIAGLVLVHNLYTAAANGSRPALQMPLIALTLIWAFDLNANTVAYLARTEPIEIIALRGWWFAPLAGLFMLGALRTAGAPIKLSRSAAFQSLSLLAIGVYLILMVGGSAGMRLIGDGAARTFQVDFIFLTGLGALILLPNTRLRARLRVLLAKHFFQHRYDYRAEWLRFTNTLSSNAAGATPLNVRAIKAIADITESSAGLLLTPEAAGNLIARAEWNWPMHGSGGNAASARTLLYFRQTARISELDSVRQGKADDDEAAAIPEWLLSNNRAWIIVPLLHFDELAGIVVLDRPTLDRPLDWEDFDLLRLAGRQVASYLAEEQGQEALADAQRFEEFNRRFAFIMHDIKNLVSQLSLVSRNAQNHIADPEFQQDMLATLHASTERMNALLARLSQHNKSKPEAPRPTALAPIINAVAASKRLNHPVIVTGSGEIMAQIDGPRLEQALSHLVQNAIEASPAHEPVTLLYALGKDGPEIEVVDHGIGMSGTFIRDQLFRPFASTKASGFGVGAHEARALITDLRGTLSVRSRPSHGTTFTVCLPAVSRDHLSRDYILREQAA